jgi:transposase
VSTAVAPRAVPDELWGRIEPLLPRVERRFRYPGRKRLPDRQALQGILFVLHTGIAWRHLPPGLPLAWTLTGGNRNDVTQLIPLVERVPPVRGKVGRPRRRPERVTADRGYDHDKYRRELRRRGITSEIARRQTEPGSGLGRASWVVERRFAWLHHFKRLLVRYDRRAEIHEAFLALGGCLVCFRRLRCSF